MGAVEEQVTHEVVGTVIQQVVPALVHHDLVTLEPLGPVGDIYIVIDVVGVDPGGGEQNARLERFKAESIFGTSDVDVYKRRIAVVERRRLCILVECLRE